MANKTTETLVAAGHEYVIQDDKQRPVAMRFRRDRKVEFPYGAIGYDSQALEEAVAEIRTGVEAALAGKADTATAAIVNTTPTEKGFWTEDGLVNIWRFRDRVFVGDGADNNGSMAGGGSWLSLSSGAGGAGYNWMERTTQFLAVHSKGGTAVTGATRNSDKAGLVGHTTIGVAGVAVADLDYGSGVWGGYFEVMRRDGINLVSYAMEVDAKNSGSRVETSPYLRWTAGATIGIWLAAGGDGTVSPTAANPSSNALLIGANSERWVKGIVFQSNGLEGTDGTGTGKAIAISMARGQAMEWRHSNAGISAEIRSDNGTASSKTAIVFNGSFFIRGVASDLTTEVNLFEIAPNPGAVNNLKVTAGATGSAPAVVAVGSDAAVSLDLISQGAGDVNIRTNGGSGATTQFRVFHQASATDFIAIRGGGGSGLLTVAGSSANAGVTVRAKGTGAVAIQDGNSNARFQANSTGLAFFGTTPVGAKTGWGAATGTATRTTFATSTVTLPELAERVKALIDDLHQTAGYGLLRT